jgi:hypothetical protein
MLGRPPTTICAVVQPGLRASSTRLQRRKLKKSTWSQAKPFIRLFYAENPRADRDTMLRRFTGRSRLRGRTGTPPESGPLLHELRGATVRAALAGCTGVV